MASVLSCVSSCWSQERYPRVEEIRRDLWRPNPCSGRASWRRVPRRTPRRLPNASKEGTPQPGQSVPGWTHPNSEGLFSDVQTELPMFQFSLIASCPAPRHHLAASSLHIPFRYTLMRSPWDFLRIYRSRSLTSPHRGDAPVPSSYFWSFIAPSVCLYADGVPRTGHITPDVASPVWNREEEFPSMTWQC